MLSTGHYLAGAAELAVIASAATFGGARLRSRLLPGWSGAPAWLATAVLAVALLIGVAEVLGSAGLFEDLALLAGALAAAVGAALWAGGERREGLPPPAPPAGRGLSLAAVAIAAVAVAHFTIGVRLRLSTGMTGFDSTWYHGPFAAGFAQSGDTFGIQLIAPQFLAWFYPQNSELLHGVGNVAFGRDLLSPLLNLGWLCGCLLAAWCVGRPYGAAPLSLAGVAVAIDTGALADQAGEARNDLVAAFFLLAALALAVNAWASSREDRAGPPAGVLVVVGLAAGLAAGTKLNYLLPAVVLVCALALIAPRGARSRALAYLALPAVAGCGYWYLRNLVHAGSPLPWIRHLGPIDLPAPDQPIGGRAAHSVLGYLTDGSVWSDWFLPGLHHAFGVLWPLLLAGAAAGLLAALAQRREPALRVAGLTGAALAVAWLVAPTSASGPDGLPRGFESGLRYLAPAIAIGLALLPTSPRLRTDGRRWAVMAALAVTLPFTDASGEPWHTGYLAAAVAAGVLAAAAAVALLSPRVRSLSRRTAYAVTAMLLLLAVAAGAKGQRTYLENRYANPHFTLPGLDAAFKWARSISGARIGTTATREYPFLGTDLSNRVRFVGEERPHGGFVGITSCPAWRRAVNAGDFDYVVTSLDRLPSGGRRFAPQAVWTQGPQAEVVLRRAPTVVFRLHGPLDPAACPQGGGGGQAR